jgi:hypothetical protein
MRYTASEKLEIIRLVEQSHLSARRASPIRRSPGHTKPKPVLFGMGARIFKGVADDGLEVRVRAGMRAQR